MIPVACWRLHACPGPAPGASSSPRRRVHAPRTSLDSATMIPGPLVAPGRSGARADLERIADLGDAARLAAVGLPFRSPTRVKWRTFQAIGEQLHARARPECWLRVGRPNAGSSRGGSDVVAVVERAELRTLPDQPDHCLEIGRGRIGGLARRERRRPPPAHRCCSVAEHGLPLYRPAGPAVGVYSEQRLGASSSKCRP